MTDPTAGRAAANSKPQTPDSGLQTPNSRLLATALTAGFISIVGQSLIIRELVIAFLGNELVIGVTLGAWLLWTGVGSVTIGRLGERSKSPAAWLATELTLLAVLLPLCFLATGHVRSLAGLEQGEIAGPIPVILTCLALLCPLCIFNGSIFPTLCRAASDHLAKGAAIAKVYVWEAIGSAAGGVLFAAAIIRLLQPTYAVLVCSLAALAFAVSVAQRRRVVALIIGVCVLAAAGALSFRARDRPEHINTIYGRTSVGRREETVSVFHSGLLSCTYPLGATSEFLVHLAMLQLERPQRILLIGGLGGTAEQVLKYRGVNVDIVELDPDSVSFVRRFKPPSPLLDGALERGRARLIFRDGRRHVAQYDGEPYDAIILSLPKPITAQINRYYTAEFFRAAARILSDGGVLAFSVESAPNISTSELAEFIACLKRTLGSAFENVVVTPGDFNTFVAVKGTSRPTLDPDVLLERLDARKITTRIFEATIHGDLNAFNIELFDEILAESKSTRLNTDLHPISYSHGLVVWTAKERTPRSGILQRLIDAPIRWLTGFAAWSPVARGGIGLAAVGLCAVLLLVVRPGRSAATGLAVACGGFTEITVEIVALLAFQALYGYVYVMLGLILASFMVGLCAGGACAGGIVRAGRREFAWLLRVQSILAVYPLILIGVIWAASRTGAAGWPVAAAFLALTFIAGFTGGVQFPLAVGRRRAAGRGRRRALGARLVRCGGRRHHRECAPHPHRRLPHPRRPALRHRRRRVPRAPVGAAPRLSKSPAPRRARGSGLFKWLPSGLPENPYYKCTRVHL